MASRRYRCLLPAWIAALAIAAPAQAFEAWDGRFQAHGFFETQLRVISGNYNEDWDLTQWYNILNIELELSLIEDKAGPFDLLSAFARVEARYDCVWTRACGVASSADTYGNRSRRLPWRLANAEEPDYSGVVNLQPNRTIFRLGKNRPGFDRLPVNPDAGEGIRNSDPHQHSSVRPGELWRVVGFDTLFEEPGVDGIFFTDDDPAFFTFPRFLDYRFGMRELGGPEGGNTSTQTLGPWLPKNSVESIGSTGSSPNLFNPLDTLEVPPLTGQPGSGALPYRPPPTRAAGLGGDLTVARGLYIPSPGLVKEIRSGHLDGLDINFRQAELAWNRGASQQDEKELKEAYLDAEFLDSRLWVRLGKQNIVWGKTELFRTTDQFNPQDFALASLPALEESRIALWAARFVYSLYSVGPLDDVRVEIAFNYDQYEPNDLGTCGEPYAVNAWCAANFGMFAHGALGIGVAGIDRPNNPWDSFSGLEIGGRVEFRWERFSFAMVDFWGYEDLPHPDRIWTYSRNVDLDTGRAVAGELPGTCDPSALGLPADVDLVNDALSQAQLDALAAQGCLLPGNSGVANALQNHHANIQLFTTICSSTIGFTDLDPSVCAQSIFNSTSPQPAPVTDIVSAILSGSITGSTTCQAFIGVSCPTVILNRDADDGGSGSPFFPPIPPFPPMPTDFSMTIGNVFSDHQEGLIGCGVYWGTNCDHSHEAGFSGFPTTVIGGLDLLNTEASFIAQAFVGIEGTDDPALLAALGISTWQTNLTSLPQPGTVVFAQGDPAQGFPAAPVPVCTRFIGGGSTIVLPGCRGIVSTAPGLDGFVGTNDDVYTGERDLFTNALVYDPRIDGCARSDVDGLAMPGYCMLSNEGAGARNLMHPFTGQQFRSEGAAFSWNVMMLLAGFSCLGEADVSAPECFDGSQPMAVGRCSFVTPQFCEVFERIYNVIGVRRNDVRAAGTTRFGRRTFVWHSGGEVVLRYEKRNVLGFSMDFAEDLTKSNWGVEFTWIHDVPRVDNNAFDNISLVDNYNLTISVDRPTFVNFLNANRTLFLNSQWFVQYVDGYSKGFASTGPWNVLATFSVITGYHQDRLLPVLTAVYDFQSQSGALLPSVTYRYNQAFSVTVGLATFWGSTDLVEMPVNEISPAANRAGRHAYQNPVENLLSQIRDRDEVFLRLRYTF